uniref:Uncharacterized protein n=1 Tax=Cajanus cajan TaxID=3821 RepID=A0A151RMN8_CAJCA|nr:hypothetical protein KK1_034752 [Cajanus cajan]
MCVSLYILSRNNQWLKPSLRRTEKRSDSGKKSDFWEENPEEKRFLGSRTGRSAWRTARSPSSTGCSPFRTPRSARRTGRSPSRTGRSAWRTARSPSNTGRSPSSTGRFARRTGRSPSRTGRSARRTGRSQSRTGRSAAFVFLFFFKFLRFFTSDLGMSDVNLRRFLTPT